MSFFAQYPPSSGGSSANASVGVNNDPIPGSSTLVAGENPSGDLQPLQTNLAGDLLVEINTETSGLATAANQVTGNNSIASIDTKTPALGQALMAASQPVVIASNQTAVPISATALPLPAGAATEATLASLNGKVTVVNTGSVTVVASALPTGAATEDKQDDQIDILGNIGGYTSDAAMYLSELTVKAATTDVPLPFDYREFSYVGATQNIDTIVYKQGGGAGTTVATQTFTYDGSNRLESITATY